jgi:hypothetical protein
MIGVIASAGVGTIAVITTIMARTTKRTRIRGRLRPLELERLAIGRIEVRSLADFDGDPHMPAAVFRRGAHYS